MNLSCFTFKVKQYNDQTETYETVVALYCPTEVFYNSVKQSKEYFEVPKLIVTRSDYYKEEKNLDKVKPFYSVEDEYFGDVAALLNSSKFEDWLRNPFEEDKDSDT